MARQRASSREKLDLASRELGLNRIKAQRILYPFYSVPFHSLRTSPRPHTDGGSALVEPCSRFPRSSLQVLPSPRSESPLGDGKPVASPASAHNIKLFVKAGGKRRRQAITTSVGGELLFPALWSERTNAAEVVRTVAEKRSIKDERPLLLALRKSFPRCRQMLVGTKG